MAIGVSYFGNRIFRHVAADMDGLARRGFTGVLHTFSENDLLYYREAMGRIVERSKAAGLLTQVGPWGLGRTFGGEAETAFVAAHPEVAQVLDNGRRVPAGCPNAPGFRAFVRSWAAAAVETGADRVFWDEPHFAHPSHFDEPEERWGCRCEHCRVAFGERYGEPMPDEFTPEVGAFREASLVDFVADMVAEVGTLGGRSTVCLLPFTDGSHGLRDWSAVAALRGLDTLATDPYWQAFGQPAVPFVTRWSEHVAGLAARFGVNAQIWVQGFRLGPDDAADIHAAVAPARAAGVSDLWTWGYEACGQMSYLATRDPQRVWAVLTEALLGHPGPPQERPGRAPGTALAELVTEQGRPELAELDRWETERVVALMAAEEHTVAEAVAGATQAITGLVDAVAGRIAAGGRLVYVGAGTPGRLGVLDAAECGPTFGAGAQVVAVIAGGEAAVTRPIEGAEDDEAQGAADLCALGVGGADAVIGVSASGRTPYVVGALTAARAAGALTAVVVCQPGAVLSAAVDHPVEVVVGPEVIAGSTRLKAGSAQKLVLNTISTAVMVRLGRTWGNLMVGVASGSGKLADRGRRIVAEATGASPAHAAAALEAAGGEVATAVVAILAGVGPAEARRRLEVTGGAVRAAVERP